MEKLELNELTKQSKIVAQRAGQRALYIFIFVVISLALLFVAMQVNNGSMTIKNAALFFGALVIFGLYIGWIAYFFQIVRPWLATKFGHLLNVTIIDFPFFGVDLLHGFRGYVTGWNIEHKWKAPFYLKFLVTVIDLVLLTLSIVGVFTILMMVIFFLY